VIEQSILDVVPGGGVGSIPLVIPMVTGRTRVRSGWSTLTRALGEGSLAIRVTCRRLRAEQVGATRFSRSAEVARIEARKQKGTG
jgi:hypothetical protein